MKRTRVEEIPSEIPAAVAGLIRGAELYDSRCSEAAEVYYADRDGGMFLKIAAAGELKTEAAMTAYFHSLGLSAEVLFYATEGERDFMLTRRIPGEDCTDPAYLSAPERLCDTIAGLLRRLHETDFRACPVQDRIGTCAASVKQGVERGRYEPDLFRGLWEFSSPEEARRTALEGLPLLKREVLLHGDYCLPNILLRDWRFSGFIDLGCGGVGDRHIDVLWGIWTLNFNLHTMRLTDRFLDAYGRDRIEPDKLRQIAAMEMIGG